MKIESFRTEDIDGFLKLAAAENWLTESWEFEFLLSQFPQGCFAARADNGETAGYVTSLRHDKSGWIGNLIVSPEFRGQKIGEKLFVTALEALRGEGVETVWLTASKSGMPLYQKFGFKSIDTIIRWVGSGRQKNTATEAKIACESFDPMLNEIDGRAWGDQRTSLMEVISSRGQLLQRESAFAVLQSCGGARQIGPFLAPDYSSADALLKAALNLIPLGAKVYLDAPVSNRAALSLFNRKNIRISGSNELMYAGLKPSFNPECIFGLATMGSCG